MLVFAASASMIVVAALTRAAFPPDEPLHGYGYFDLRVYRAGAGVVLSGGQLYSARFGHGLGFTYPPFAAIAFVALRLVSLRVDEIGVTFVNVALVAVLAHRALRLHGGGWEAALRARRATAAWLAAAAALWIAPVTSAIGYGQIDLVIAALVLVDLTGPRDAPWGGLAIGLAAALKLTPLIFVPYLACSGRPRMAARALGGFALSIALAFDVTPGDARVYWTRGVFGISRITGGGPGRGPANQSLRGAALRIISGASSATVVWLVACGLVGAAGLLLSVRATRRGNEAWGFVLIAVTGLLLSPVSWIHHWAIATPGLLLALTRWRGSRWERLRAFAAAAFVVGAPTVNPVVAAHPLGAHLRASDLLLGDLYVLAGLAVILAAAALELAGAHRPLGGASRSARPPRPPAEVAGRRDRHHRPSGSSRRSPSG